MSLNGFKNLIFVCKMKLSDGWCFRAKLFRVMNTSSLLLCKTSLSVKTVSPIGQSKYTEAQAQDGFVTLLSVVIP